MARAHLYRPITDASGDLQEGTIVRVLQPDSNPITAQPVTGAVYASKTGDAVLGTTFTASDGVIDLWMDDPQYVLLGLTPIAANEYFVDNVPVVGPGGTPGPKGDKGDRGSDGITPSLSDVKKTIQALDITTTRPTFLASLQLARTSVMQHAQKEPETGDFYVSQAVTGTTGVRETTVISRVSATGVLLDSMTLEDAGHGTTVGLERTGGTTYLWLAWAAASPTGTINDLVRFAYSPGVTLRRADEGSFQVMPKFSPTGYVIVAFDWANDYVAYRESSGTSDVYTRRKISEVKQNIDKAYGKVTLTQGTVGATTYTMQGFATIDDSLYRYTGNTNSTTDPAQITRYDWTTGAVTGVVNTDRLGVNPDGTTLGNTREPEGISLFRDPTSGLPSMTAGVTVGPANGRTYLLYLFAPIGADHFFGTQTRALEGLIPVRKDMRGRRMPPGTTSMDQLNTPGWWYLTGAEFGTMTDRPSDASSTSGHWLEVSGYDTGATMVQRLVRNSSVTVDQYARVVSTAGTRSNWFKATTTSVPY